MKEIASYSEKLKKNLSSESQVSKKLKQIAEDNYQQKQDEQRDRESREILNFPPSDDHYIFIHESGYSLGLIFKPRPPAN